MVVDREVVAGQRIYSPGVLAIYDTLVLGLIGRHVWRCPPGAIARLYDSNVGGRHLELGVGTGYFLDRCRFPVPDPRIDLVDLNPNALRHAAHRLQRYEPATHTRNALDPLPFARETFDSVALSLLLHCLPGAGLPAKRAVLAHAREVSRRGARVFGSTVLSHGVTTSGPARLLLRATNGAGILSNRHDSLVDLRRLLTEEFTDVRVEVRGQMALFEATVS